MSGGSFVFSVIVTIWFLLVGLSLLYVLYDALFRLPVSWVQKLAWILVVAYTGPVGLLMYVLSCRSPGPGRHNAYTQATWKQSVNSEMHCLAGDATGIFLAAAIVPVFGFPNGIDLVIEYVTAYGVGLFLFQAMMMVGMYEGNYLLAVRKTIFAETVSMNMVMLGMIPAMLLLNHYLMPGVEGPLTAKFWFVMSMAAIVGGVTAYPINHYLVRKRLKHGCMTIRRDDPHRGHRSAEAAGPAAGGHAGHAGHTEPMAAGHAGHAGHTEHAAGGHAGHAEHAAPMAGEHAGHAESTAAGDPTEHAGHQMGQISMPWTLFCVTASFAAMLAAAWLTSLVVPIDFVR